MTRPKGAARRDEILAVTCEVVRERGFAHTRMSDVAHRLGVSPPLVVYHFGSKDALLAEAFAYASRNEMVDLDAIADATDAPLDRLDALLVSGLGPSTRASWALWIDSWGEALRSPVLRKTWRQLDDRWRAVLEEVVEQGMKAGVFVTDDAAEMAAVLAALIDGFGVQVALSSSRRAVSLDQARRVALALLGVSAAQPRP
jgi:AcrR family transcriptional regulator